MTKPPADHSHPAIGDQLNQPGLPVLPFSRSPTHPLTRSPAHWLALAIFLLFLAIYTRTAAPSVLSGDSAEFQLAAPLLGVAHPTTYPLYVLLGKLATLVVPIGDLAWRVTLVSVVCAALAVMLMFLLARQVTGSTGAAAVAALALGVTPGLWNAATLAEVYALLAALLAGLGYLLVSSWSQGTVEPEEQRTKNKEQREPGNQGTREPQNQEPGEPEEQRTKNKEQNEPWNQRTIEAQNRSETTFDPRSSILDLRSSPAHMLSRSATWRLLAAAFVAGLGCTHHGLFVLAGLPLLAGYLLWRIRPPHGRSTERPTQPPYGRSTERPFRPPYGRSTGRPTQPPYGRSTERPIHRTGVQLNAPSTDHRTGVQLNAPSTDRRQKANDRTPALYGGPSMAAHPATRFLPFTLSFLPLRQLAILALCFTAGLAPWLYPLAQYARYGPFDGQDYGLPGHYFWGAPRSWAEVFDLIGGGALRRGIFRLPSAEQVLEVLRLVAGRMWFEFGPLGVLLGLLGAIVLARRSRGVWAGASWVFLITLAYLLLLGPAVADAPVFTLPMLLPWALWIAAAVDWILAAVEQRTKNKEQNEPQNREPENQRTREPGDRRQETNEQNAPALGTANREPENQRTRKPGDQRQENSKLKTRVSPGHLRIVSASHLVTVLLIAATLAWGYTRVQHSSKRRLWLFREFGQATLAALPPQAAVITHWEQGMTLQYLRLVEGQRPDVWIDVVEPSDEAWGTRARRRYAGRPVFFVGSAADVAGLPVELLREAEYAGLFQLREER